MAGQGISVKIKHLFFLEEDFFFEYNIIKCFYNYCVKSETREEVIVTIVVFMYLTKQKLFWSQSVSQFQIYRCDCFYI